MRATTRRWLAAWGLLVAGPVLSLWTGPARGEDAAAARALPAPYVTRQSDVEIPFTVKPGATPDTQPASVRVFVSWDRGQTWHFLDEKRPADGRFRFQPKQDGEYWFATQTIDRSGRTDSGQPRRPQLRLVIDTQKPQLLAQATVGPTSDVTLAFSATDPTLQPATLKLEYQDASGKGDWKPVEIDPATANASAGQAAGRANFKPPSGLRTINLRAEVADAAGNTAYFSQRLSLTPPKPLVASNTGGPAADPSATRWPETNPFVEQVAEDAAPDASARTSQAPATSTANGQTGSTPQEIRNDAGRMASIVQNPYARQDRLVSATPGQNAYERPTPTLEGQLSPPAEELPPPSQSQEPVSSPAARDAGPYNPSTNPEYSPGEPGPGYSPAPEPQPQTSSEPAPTYGSSEPAAESLPPPSPEQLPAEPAPTYSQPAEDRSTPPYTSVPVEPPPTASSSPAPAVESVEAPAGHRPRLTNQRRFSLDYDVETVGPEGLADVELWGTTDGGRTWVKWGSDPDRRSPFDVEVNNEAAYGFRVVIIGKSGLASNAPQPGDAADIWVGIDLTRPSARLTSAAYGQGNAAGKLDIRWDADDVNLASRPVTLLVSDRPDGVFAPVAAGLPDSGQYFWEFDPRSPRQIYLRLEVRDEAGNVAVDQLTEPILVEGLQPKGRIRGFNPAAGPEQIGHAQR